MKKKLMALTLASGILLTQTISAATMYALDGRTLEVNDNEIEAYRQVNWYYGKPVTMYALDGRTLTVGENDVEMYRQVGWYYGKPVTMYALDGRTLTVGENDVEMYRQVGWYYGKPVTMYALDGRTLTVGENDVEMYRQVGWYYGKPVTMYAPDGRTLTVGKNDVEMYENVGWYRTAAEARKTYAGTWYLYSGDRLYMTVTLSNITSNSMKVTVEKMAGKAVIYNIKTAYFINNTTATTTGTTYVPAYGTTASRTFRFELKNNKVYMTTDDLDPNVYTR